MTEGVATDGRPAPEVGEVRELTELSWDPWLLVFAVDEDEQEAKAALLDQPDDDALQPVPDATIGLLEYTVGDRPSRREIAKGVDVDDEIDAITVPFDRLDVVGQPGIQGCDAPTPHAGGGSS